MTPSPIVVIGINRSGTKWLSNLLCNHSEVVGVQNERHNGVLETNFFGQMQRAFGDLAAPDNYVALVEAWAQTDFFKATGCDKELLYRQRPRPRSYRATFELVLGEMARLASARFWLQKTSPLQASYVLSSFPEARVLVMRRDIVETVHSALQLARNRGRHVSVPRLAFRFALEEKLLRRVIAQVEPTEVQYASLSADTIGELRRICSALGLSVEPGMQTVRFARNTSFDSGARRPLSEHDRRTAIAVYTAARALPLPALSWIRERFRERSQTFVRGTYREIVERYSLE